MSRMHGKWAQEVRLIEQINNDIRTFKSDFSKNISDDPIKFIEKKIEQLQALAQKTDCDVGHSFFDFRRVILQKEIGILQLDCKKLAHDIYKAHREAQQIAEKYADTIGYISVLYESDSLNKYKSGNGVLFAEETFSSFEKTRHAGAHVWAHMRYILNSLHDSEAFHQKKHNALAHLLLANDNVFLMSVDADCLALDGEIGYLMINRLKDIHASSQSTRRMKKIAGRKIDQVMPLTQVESLLSYEHDLFIIEITKLLLHAHYHPGKKIAWLGTAHAVNAVIEQSAGEGMYFNPNRAHFSWMLNRIWLQTALHLGYHFKLIEQHFPAIEAALLSQNPAQFLAQLSLEMREESTGNCSQYNGDSSPTATTQEILALMDMGCTAKKNQTTDHGIFLSPLEKPHEEPFFLKQHPRVSALRKNHSAPNLTHASTPPPFDTRLKLFTMPDTGERVQFKSFAKNTR
jgi:hypothetical protein